MSRTSRVADRIGYSDAINLRCSCGKRLAFLAIDEYDTVANGGIWLVEMEKGQAILADDWRRVICPRCRRDWRGRDSQLLALLRDARLKNVTSVTLPSPGSRARGVLLKDLGAQTPARVERP